MNDADFVQSQKETLVLAYSLTVQSQKEIIETL
jgi:hypothetical protein